MRGTIFFRRWAKNAAGDWVEPVNDGVWDVAYSADELEEKLGGDMATVDWPAAAWYVRLWRMMFPMKMIEGATTRSDTTVIEL